jgi:hypothetical protein
MMNINNIKLYRNNPETTTAGSHYYALGKIEGGYFKGVIVKVINAIYIKQGEYSLGWGKEYFIEYNGEIEMNFTNLTLTKSNKLIKDNKICIDLMKKSFTVYEESMGVKILHKEEQSDRTSIILKNN